MENIRISKAASMGKLHGRFLKDGAESLLVKFVTSRSLMEYFLMPAKLQNSDLFSRKASKSTRLIKQAIKYLIISLDSDLITRLICVYLS